MADYKTLIKDKKTQNWLKASIAFNITKDGLSDFVNNIAGHLQQTILTDVQKNNRLLVTATCNVCRTGNAVHCQSTKKCPNSCNLHKDTSITYNVCPNHICHNFATELKKYHRYNQPSFKNTYSTKWCSSAWELAKCFHPPDGYLDKPDASVTDFNGVVSVIINCKEFDNHVTENLSDKKNIFVQSRDVVKSIRHTATLQVEDADLKDAFTVMRAILSDTKTLSGNIQAQEAMNTLALLEADNLTITIEDVVKLIQDSLDDTQGIISEAKHTNEETKELQSKLNSKEEELKKLFEAITKARDEAIKDVSKASEIATKAATDKIKIAGEDVTKVAKDKIKIASEDVTKAATDKIKTTGEDVTKVATDKIKTAGEDVTKVTTDKIKTTGEDVTKVATDKIKTTGEDITKATKDKIKTAGEDVTKVATDKIKTTGEDVTKVATDKIKTTGEDITKATKDKIKTAGEDVTKVATDKMKIAGEDVTKVATDKIKTAGEDVTKVATDKIKTAGEDVTKVTTDKIKIAGEDVTKVTTDKIKTAGEDVTKATTDKIKTAGEDVTKVAKDKIKNTGEDVTKATTDKITLAGQMEESRVQETGQTVKQDVELTGEYATKAATEKMKIAGEDVTKVATDKIKIAGQIEESRILKETGQTVKQAGEKTLSYLKTKISEEVGTAKKKLEIEKDILVNVLEDVTATNMSQLDNKGAKVGERIQQTGDTVVQVVTEVLGDVTATNLSQLDNKGAKVGQRIQQTGDTVVQVVTEVLDDVTATNLSELDKKGATVIERIQQTGDTVEQVVKEAIRTQGKKTADENYEEKKNELQQALAHHYWTEHDSMPLSPLMPEEDDKLAKFYMPLKMNKMDTKSSTKSVQTKDNVDTYKSLFYNDNNSYRNIYIQGEAGIGKSTFCTKLGLIWSEKNLPDCYKKDSSINKSTVKPKLRRVFTDESVISTFDFVFSLALRNVKNECEIEKMIEKQIINELPDCIKYAGLVPTILDKERCLIILDGLDEWSHRSDLCEKSGRVPHRKSWSNTAVLTSTRPWKINEVRLRDSEISTLIQVTGLTDSETFIENVLNCLNDKYNKTLDVKDFITYMKDKQLEHFLDTPVVAMQLLWLWYDGHELGDSKCKIYINMLDMLFGRAGEKSPSVSDDIADSLKAGLPPCFESTEFFEQHKMLLDCLGSLAFHTLYSSKREETLVFSESIVKSHVKSAATLKTALKTGILSQYKSPSRTVRRSHFSFLHKTFQEFLAAYYIATHVDESENIVKTLFQVYGQTVDVMDISELFIFVCGLNTEMSRKISDSVMKSFSDKLTNHIEELHVSGDYYKVADMTQSLQEMILAGYKESIGNGHQDPQLALHHVYYYSDCDSRHRDISDDDKIYRLVDRNKDKIVTLSAGKVLETCTVDVLKIQQILAQSSSTLSHVSLENVEGLTDASLDLFTNITLKSLYLFHINTHFDIKLNTSSLLYCHLQWINKELEHSVLSALTTAPKLHTLEVRYCKNMSVLCQVLPTLPMLHTLHVRERMIPASLCRVMSTLSQLQRLAVEGWRGCEDPSLLCQLPSTLSNLQYIKLDGHIDLGDNDILLPNSIQEIMLDRVKLTCRSFRQLLDRLTQIPHKVTCKLWLKCTVRPEEEWDAIVKHIQQSHMFEIHKIGDICSSGYIHFTKIQK